MSKDPSYPLIFCHSQGPHNSIHNDRSGQPCMYICIEILQPYMGPELKFAAFFQGGPKNHGYKWSLKWVATLKKRKLGLFHPHMWSKKAYDPTHNWWFFGPPCTSILPYCIYCNLLKPILPPTVRFHYLGLSPWQSSEIFRRWNHPSKNWW